MDNVRKLKTISFLWGASYSLPIITLYFLFHNVTLQNIVISQTLYSLVSFLAELPSGIFADRYGQKASIVVGYAIEALAVYTMVLLPNIYGLYAAFCIVGVAESFLSGSQEALLYESLKKDKKEHSYSKVYGAFMSNQNIHFAISTTISGVMLSLFGDAAYVPLLTITTFMYIAATILSLTLSDLKTEVEDPTKGRHVFSILKQSFDLFKRERVLRALIYLPVLTLSGEWILLGIYQPYFQQANVPNLFIGWVLAGGAILNFLILRNIYRLEKYFTLEKIMIIVNVPVALGYLGMALFVHPIFLILVFITMKGLFESIQPIISDYVNEYTVSNIRATVLSGLSFARSFANILLRLSMAFIIGAWGTKAAFISLGVYLTIGTMFAYWLLVKCGCTRRIHKTSTS